MSVTRVFRGNRRIQFDFNDCITVSVQPLYTKPYRLVCRTVFKIISSEYKMASIDDEKTSADEELVHDPFDFNFEIDHSVNSYFDQTSVEHLESK